LVATVVGPRIEEDHLFLTRSGKLMCKLYFMVDAERYENSNLKVKLGEKVPKIISGLRRRVSRRESG
jgi:hypothetical protein